MAICKTCNLEMTDPTTTSCKGEDIELTGDERMLPTKYNPPPMLSEAEWIAEFRSLNGRNPDDSAKRRMAEYMASDNRCHDCGIKPGGFHHPGCDNERCPRCQGQLISCGCLGDDEPESKTDQQIVDDCNRLARVFYKMNGYEVPEGYRFDQARHPQERGSWNLAAVAYLHIEGTDPDEALQNLEDET